MYNRYLSNAAPQRLEEPTIGAAASRHLAEPAGSTAAPQRETGFLERLRGLLRRFGGSGEEKNLFTGVPVLEKLDSGDILLILVLIFLFRESEDEEWLIILALVLLMGL